MLYMNSRVYYKYLTSRIASKWAVLLIDLLIVLISMMLSYILHWRILSEYYHVYSYVWLTALTVLCSAFFFGAFHIYVGIIRFSSFVDIYRVFLCVTFIYVLLGFGNICWHSLDWGEALPGSILFIAYILTLSLMICLRVAVKILYEAIAFDARHSVNVFIYGFRGTGVNVAKSLRVNRNNHFRLRGFISDEPTMIGRHTMGCKVYANDRHLFDRLAKANVKTVIVSPGKEVELEKTGMMEVFHSHNIHVMTLPPFSDCVDDGVIKDIQIEDWLRREPVQVDIRKITSHIEGRRIMIIGAAGTVGREIVRQLAALNPYQLILVDQAESPLYDVQLELSDHWKNLDVRVVIADIVNYTRLESVFQEMSPQMVFHAAAYNNERLMDDFISEAIQTNLEGVLNVAGLSLKYNVYRCVVVSTDKVIGGESVVDRSKRLGEMAALSLANKVPVGVDKRLMIVRLGEIYPYNSRSLITMTEVCQLLLEVCCIGENSGVYLLDGIPVLSSEPTSCTKIIKCKVKEYNYEKVCANLSHLINQSYTESRSVLRHGINSFSETSQ